MKGLLVDVNIERKNWEDRSCMQLKTVITDGIRSFIFVHSDHNSEFPEIESMRRGRVRISSAHTDKGMQKGPHSNESEP